MPIGVLSSYLQMAAEFRTLSHTQIWRLQKIVVFLPPFTGYSDKLTFKH